MTGITLYITAGHGPKECQWAASKLADIFQNEAKSDGLKCQEPEKVEGTSSFLLVIDGEGAEAFVQARTGSIRWIGQSPFRPNHKRKNWYIGVKPISKTADIPELRDQDIIYDSFRASGPGGQHVNTTDSAVRATHIPSGISTTSQNQRSQFMNKKIARLKLALFFEEQRQKKAEKSKEDFWQLNWDVERGNEVRCYEGLKFRLRR